MSRLAIITKKSDFLSVVRGGPGYWHVLRLRGGRKGKGKLLALGECWDDELVLSIDSLKKFATGYGYEVVEVKDVE